MTYVFDIDGTQPFHSRIEFINKLFEEGHTIYFLTARGMGRSNNSAIFADRSFYGMTKIQLDSWGLKYHQLFLGKPAGDIYVDDKGIKDEEFFRSRD